MHHLTWSNTEKRIARAVFDGAAEVEIAELVSDFKQKAAAVNSLDQLWALRKHLEETERNFYDKFDYRYSQLIFIFARLIREGRIQEADLEGLSEEKLDYIHRMVTL